MDDSKSSATEYASQIVEQLLADGGKRLDLELEDSLVISDLETDADTFSTELDIAKKLDIRMPAVRINGDDRHIPVSFFSIFGLGISTSPNGMKRSLRWWREDPLLNELLYRFFASYRNEEEIAGFPTINRDEARETFTRRATNFLATRIAAVRRFDEVETRERDAWGKPARLNLLQRAGGSQVATPGCYFSVSTNSNGLRVFWSGAYYITPNYFSHPTSPANSVLQAGTYVFGVDGGAYGNTIQWDTHAVVSLPGNPSIHLNY